MRPAPSARTAATPSPTARSTSAAPPPPVPAAATPSAATAADTAGSARAAGHSTFHPNPPDAAVPALPPAPPRPPAPPPPRPPAPLPPVPPEPSWPAAPPPSAASEPSAASAPPHRHGHQRDDYDGLPADVDVLLGGRAAARSRSPPRRGLDRDRDRSGERWSASSRLRLAGRSIAAPRGRRESAAIAYREPAVTVTFSVTGVQRQIARHLDEQDRVRAVAGRERRRGRDGGEGDEGAARSVHASEPIVSELGGRGTGRPASAATQIGAHRPAGDRGAERGPEPGVAPAWPASADADGGDAIGVGATTSGAAAPATSADDAGAGGDGQTGRRQAGARRIRRRRPRADAWAAGAAAPDGGPPSTAAVTAAILASMAARFGAAGTATRNAR